MSTARIGDVSAERVAAAVVTYNRAVEIGTSIDALLGQSVVPAAIIVVDNASSDGTAELIRARYPSVVLVPMTENSGAAGGFAEALRVSAQLGYEWTWTFNDDDVPDPSALDVLLRAMPSLSDRTAVVGCARRGEGGEHWSLGAIWANRHREVPYTGQTDVLELDVLTFSGALVSTRATAAVGVPRPDFFMMAEDLEYCLRLRRAGWLIAVVPIPLVTARAMGSTGGAPAWRCYYQTRNHLLMAIEHRSVGEVSWWGLRTAKFVASNALRGPAGRRRVRARVRGAWDGARGVSGRTIDPPAPAQVGAPLGTT